MLNSFVGTNFGPGLDRAARESAVCLHKPARTIIGSEDRPTVYNSSLHTQRRAFPGRAAGFARKANSQELEIDRIRRRFVGSHQVYLARFQKIVRARQGQDRRWPAARGARKFPVPGPCGNLDTEYYAFCDQDDIWEPDKLARAIKLLEKAGPGIPAVYGSRTRLIDEDGNEIGFSPLFCRRPDFRCALVQSIAGGNTMVFNQKARELLMFCGAGVNVPSHDWWLYQVTSACGGDVHYDAYPSVRYRQHPQNVIGSNMGWTARVHRLHMLQQGRFRHWEDLNVAALTRLRPRMGAENRRILDLFCKARHEPLLRRATIFAQTGVYRQTLLGNLGLVAAVVPKKI